MLEFFIAIGFTVALLLWVGWHAVRDPDGLKDPNQRVKDLELKVAALEQRLETSK